MRGREAEADVDEVEAGQGDRASAKKRHLVSRERHFLDRYVYARMSTLTLG